MAWELIAQSFTVLRKDKKLILFPILSALGASAVAAACVLSPLGLGLVARSHEMDASAYVLLFLWYCASYFVMVFFNCALAACAQVRFAGGEPSLRDGMRRALGKVAPILLWVIVSSTVGVILRAVEQRAGWIVRIATSIFGMAWGMATYLIVPVLVIEDQDVFSAIKRSSGCCAGPGERRSVTASVSCGWVCC